MTDASAGPVSPSPPLLSFEEFKKMSLRVGKVLEASDHPNAQKLLVLKVDLGGGDVRPVVAGIKPWYTPDQLVGKNLILVANLQPAKLRGVESRAMLLAATSGNEVVLCTTDREAAPGSPVT